MTNRDHDTINKELVIRYKNGDKKCADEIIALNEPYIKSVAITVSKATNTEFEDCVQNGRIGLFHAITNFDPSLGTSFMGFASAWIKKTMKRAALDDKIIKIPAYKRTILQTYFKFKNMVEEGIEQEEAFSRVAASENRTVEEVEEDVKLVLGTQISFFDGSYNNDGAKTSVDKFDAINKDLIHKYLEGKTCNVDVEDYVEYRMMVSQIKDIIKHRVSSTYEKVILAYRYGVYDESGIMCEPLSLKEIGEKLGMTRSQVYSIFMNCKQYVELEIRNVIADYLDIDRNKLNSDLSLKTQNDEPKR